MNAVFIQATVYSRFCRLLTVGSVSHITACLGRIDATTSVVITATTPPPELFCSACRADLEVRRSRAATVGLRPSVRELGATAEVEVEEWEG